MPPGQYLGTRIVWDDAADKRFLMAMLKVLSPSPPRFEDVAEAMGEGVTPAALQHRWGKIKKMLNQDGDGSASKNGNRWSKLKKQIEGGDPGPETPAKKTPAKPKATPKSGKRKAKDVSEDEDDDEQVVKKAEKDEKASAKKMKVEEHQASDEDDEAEWMV